MGEARTQAVTALLEAWNAGDEEASVRLMPLMYDELRSLARGYVARERRGHTLQPTALVHEAWVRLIEKPGVDFRNRAHFVGLTAHVMRRVLVDYARERNTAKRGGKAPKVTLIDSDSVSQPDVELMALDQALSDLTELDPRKAKLVELRFFGGLSIEETAEVLGVSPKTVVREWRRARAWLYDRLEGPAGG